MSDIDRDVLRSRLDRLSYYLRRIDEKRPPFPSGKSARREPAPGPSRAAR